MQKSARDLIASATFRLIKISGDYSIAIPTTLQQERIPTTTYDFRGPTEFNARNIEYSRIPMPEFLTTYDQPCYY